MSTLIPYTIALVFQDLHFCFHAAHTELKGNPTSTFKYLSDDLYYLMKVPEIWRQKLNLKSKTEGRRPPSVFKLTTESSRFHISQVSHTVLPSIFWIAVLCCPSSTSLNHWCLLFVAVCPKDKRPPAPPSAICSGPKCCYGNRRASHAELATSTPGTTTCQHMEEEESCGGQVLKHYLPHHHI